MVTYKNSSHFCIRDIGFYNQLPVLTKSIGSSYPGHFEWLSNVFLGGLRDGNRGYSFAIDNNKFTDVCGGHMVQMYKLAGCALLKNTDEEKKICCLFVDPEYRYQGIASHLIENSFEMLGTDKPLMTVAENNLSQLQKLINRYDFELTSVRDSVYRRGIKEYYYNEGLAKKRGA